jgi:hypothetical protein
MLGRRKEALRHAETVRLDIGRNSIQLGTIKTIDGQLRPLAASSSWG